MLNDALGLPDRRSEENAMTGKTIYGRTGSQAESIAGKVLPGRRCCTLEGCGGLRVLVEWPDGHRTWPCMKSIQTEGNHLRIV